MDEVSQIREKIDIISFIQEFVSLKKAGRNFKANCPFHTEKTPSFIVNPERQMWKCFGCQKGGDIYSFLMEYERLEFTEALRMLAKRAGIELATKPYQVAQSSRKEKIYEINNLAKEYYRYILTKHPVGKKALNYLEERGVTSKIIETFMLGFAPNTGTALTKYLLEKKSFLLQDVIDAGLTANYAGKTRDFFQGRLIFPLVDHLDNCLGFSGRILDDKKAIAKYINTRETLIYHKGSHLYGLNITKDAIRKADQAIICEGEFDVISCFQHGIANVVAIKGTALTENQVNLLARYASKITFCFDGDKAGQQALKRSMGVVEKKGLSSTVIEIPQGKDPDEALKNEPGLFKKAVREAQPVYDYFLKNLSDQTDIQTAEGKKLIADSMLPMLAAIKNEIIKEHYLRKIATLLGTSLESVSREIERLNLKKQEAIINSVPIPTRPKQEAMEEYLLSLIIQSDNPKAALEKAVKCLSGSLSKERAYQKILNHLLDHFTHSESFDGKLFVNTLPPELISSYDSSLLYPLPHFDDQPKLLSEVEKIAAKLKMLYIHQKMKELAKEIKIKEEGGMEKEAEELKKKYSKLSSQLR